jgi:hypothetical protein
MLIIIFAKEIRTFFLFAQKRNITSSFSGMVNISKIISNIDYDATQLHVTVLGKVDMHIMIQPWSCHNI